MGTLLIDLAILASAAVFAWLAQWALGALDRQAAAEAREHAAHDDEQKG